VYYDGISLSFPGKTVYEYTDYANDGSLHLLQTEDLLNKSNIVQAQAELIGDGGNSESCPTLASTYFGVNNSNQYNSGWSLYKTADGKAWEEWTEQPGVSASGTYVSLHNWSSFRVSQP
jgi:hypothetical protein